MIQHKWLTAAVVGVLASGLCFGVAAKGTPYDLGSVIVTATRTDKSVLEAPASAQVVTAKEMKEAGYTDVFDAIKSIAQANAHTYGEDGDNYGGMTSRIRLRGIDDGTLVLINGIPATFNNSSSLANIPMHQVERIEVVKGAGSALYGPQAMGGVINVITKKPTERDGVGGTVFGSLGNYYKDIGVDVMTSWVNLGYKMSWTGDQNKVGRPTKMGKGTALKFVDKSTEQWYMDARITDQLSFNYGHTELKSTYYNGKYNKFKPTWQKAGKQKTKYENFSVVYDSPENGWRIVGGYNTMNIHIAYIPPTAPTPDNDYKGYNTGLDIQKRLDLRDGHDKLVLGGTIQREEMKYSKDPVKPTQINAINSYSLYQSYDRQITDRFNLIFGMREYYMAENKFLDSSFELLPQFQGTYRLNKDSSLYFNIGRSFEMPGVNKFFYYEGNHAINPDLKPQSGWSYEIGYKWEKEHSSLTAAVFHMNIKDKFYWDKTPADENIMLNRDKWKNTGVELNYTQDINDNQTIYVGATLQNPKGQDKNGDWKQDTAKYILNAGTTYRTGKLTADLNVFTYFGREDAYYRHDGKSTYSNPPDHKLKDYIDVGLTLAYRPNEESTLRLSVKNLLDRDNTINNYEYYAKPINYTLTYEYQF